MTPDQIKQILEQVSKGALTPDTALEKLKELPFTDLGYAMIDNHRQLRRGYPEVIFCAGKTTEQVRGIVENMLTRENNILGTRATQEMYEAVKEICPSAEYNKLSKTLVVCKKEEKQTESYIAIITAGTSDIPIAEEAAITARLFGNRVETLFDVGIAGIHRLFGNLEVIRGARVLVVVAGMEGALPSIVGGLVDKPVIAVPTSVGYGAAFGGVAALLGMLTSCSSGISVVNIDNGFGAGYLAGMINKM